MIETETKISSSYNDQLLNKVTEHEKVKGKIDMLKEKYEKFEKGEIKGDEFRDFISTNLGIHPNEKIEKILKAPQQDGKNFSSIVMNLDLLNKKEGYNLKKKNNPNFNTQFHKFKKFLPPAESKESESDPNYSLKKYTKQLVSKNINPDEYREILKSHGINPNIEGINKLIRQHETGHVVKFNELLFSVIKHSDTKFDPSQINFEMKKRKFYTENLENDNGSRCMVPVNNGTGEMTYFTKKKSINVSFNSYSSNKELFDWETSTLNKIKNGELVNKPLPKDCPKNKTFFESHVFDDAPIDTPKKKKTSTSFFAGTGDFFTWKGQGAIEKKEIKRRNPNETFKEEVKVSKPTKINKMHLSSQDNVLVNNKKK